MQPAISVQSVSRHFGDISAVSELSFDVGVGEIFGLLGPNGAGKTTTINLITGMLKRHGGQIHVLGRDPQTEPRWVHRRIGLVPQETNVYLDLNAIDNLWHHAALYCDDLSTVRADMESLLKMMNLWNRRKDPMRTYSGGMKRRLVLARVLIHKPKIILFDEPTLGVDVQGREVSTWDAYQAHQLDGVWVIPVDFSERIQAGDQPFFEMHFNNYNDDRAKNHRIYAAEILWYFYEKIGYPEPPLTLEETYPRSEMIEWLPVISVGVALLSFMLGAMMNIFMLTHKEQLTKVTLEFGLTPRSLVWVLLPKTILALIMGLATGTVFLGIIYLFMGTWPGKLIFAVWLVAGLVCLFWIPLVMLAGLRKLHFFAGAVVTILTGMTIFFIGGGLALVRPFKEKVTWISWLFPNIYAVDPLRDMILFQAWPTDWNKTITILSVFALFSLVVGWFLANRQLRKLG